MAKPDGEFARTAPQQELLWIVPTTDQLFLETMSPHALGKVRSPRDVSSANVRHRVSPKNSLNMSGLPERICRPMRVWNGAN